MFPNEASSRRLVTAMVIAIAEDWQTADKCYITSAKGSTAMEALFALAVVIGLVVSGASDAFGFETKLESVNLGCSVCTANRTPIQSSPAKTP